MVLEERAVKSRFIIEKKLFLDSIIVFHEISLMSGERNPCHYFRSENSISREKRKRKEIHKHLATEAVEEAIQVCKILQMPDYRASSYPPTVFINTVPLPPSVPPPPALHGANPCPLSPSSPSSTSFNIFSHVSTIPL